MPASIVISNLAWSTPNGRQLFANLDLSFGPERAGLIGRNGVGKTTLLELISGELQPQKGAIAIDGRLAVLRQMVRVAEDETITGLFGIADELAVLRRAERGDASAEDLAAADWTLETRVQAALNRFDLAVPPDTQLVALSGGQQTRAALAAMVFREPDILVLDEPTNNLDREGRVAVIDLLSDWRGGAIVVSHDRALLEEMDVIVELTELGATKYGGNWSRYRARKALDLAAAERDLADAEKRIAELAQTAQQTVERKARKDSAGRRKAARGDAPRILIGAQKQRSENTSAEHARLVERRREQALEQAAVARSRIEVLQPMSVTLAATGLSQQKDVLKVDHVTAGYESGRPVVRDLSFTVTGPERMAIVGPNGAGKTTLLALITGDLRPWEGVVRASTRFAFLDQRATILDPALSILDNFRRLNPHADENACRAALARFMFRADAALQLVSTLSGGQVLRAGLACVLGGPAPPPLLILDEPTNHLDIASLEAVEAGLRAYDGALLIVSHDEAFLANIGISRRLTLAA